MTLYGVDLYWIPLGAGAGGAVVRFSGRVYEAITATLAHRRRRALFHSALDVTVNGVTAVVEMAPVWTKGGGRGAVDEGSKLVKNRGTNYVVVPVTPGQPPGEGDLRKAVEDLVRAVRLI